MLKAYSILAALVIATTLVVIAIRSNDEPNGPITTANVQFVRDNDAFETARLLDTSFSLLKGEYFGRQILDTIEAKTGALFSYSDSEISDSSHFSIERTLITVKVRQALKVIFKNKPIRWEFYGASIKLVRTDLYY